MLLLIGLSEMPNLNLITKENQRAHLGAILQTTWTVILQVVRVSKARERPSECPRLRAHGN